jgi:hypothetical protein
MGKGMTISCGSNHSCEHSNNFGQMYHIYTIWMKSNMGNIYQN